jgi:hypothetical protein
VGAVHSINRVGAKPGRASFHVCFDPKAVKILPQCDMSLRANKRHASEVMVASGEVVVGPTVLAWRMAVGQTGEGGIQIKAFARVQEADAACAASAVVECSGGVAMALRNALTSRQ